VLALLALALSLHVLPFATKHCIKLTK
jgi:hypothetical protein